MDVPSRKSNSRLAIPQTAGQGNGTKERFSRKSGHLEFRLAGIRLSGRLALIDHRGRDARSPSLEHREAQRLTYGVDSRLAPVGRSGRTRTDAAPDRHRLLPGQPPV